MSDPVYATRAQLASRSPAISLSGVSSDEQDKQLADASRTADVSFQAGGWTLPLTAWTDWLTDIVCWIALYNILFAKGAAAAATNVFYYQRYQEALARLAKIEKGFDPPGIVDSSEEDEDETSSHSGAVIVTSPRRGW